MDVAADIKRADRRHLLRRFWQLARGFWGRDTGSLAWIFTAAILALTLLQVYVQYLINVWNRYFFDALQQQNSAEALHQSLVFIPLVCASVAIALAYVYGRMTMARRWRESVTNSLLDRWLAKGRYYHLNLIAGEHQNPEHRIGEDVRVATEAPIDFAAGLLTAVFSAVTFIAVLWFVGGSLEVPVGAGAITIPGFLVLAAVLYAVIASGAMVVIGKHFVAASERSSQAEAEFRYDLTRVRENGESIAILKGEQEERAGLDRTFARLLEAWRIMVHQWMRTTAVSHTSLVVAPVIPVILSAPKFLAGTMSLGEVMQAASAFVTVQTAFNWLVDNYPRLAQWAASARRVTSLVVSITALERAEAEGGIKRITRTAGNQNALQLRGLSVTLDDGTGVVDEAEIEIAPGERVLIVGESGTGKSTLVRAIAGLWPWGDGEVVLQRDAKLFMLPQKPYLPIGTLRRAATYPLAADAVDDARLHEAMRQVGLEHLIERLDEDEPWDQTLSGGEKQRLAFARLLIHEPNLAVMDEATSALDPSSQQRLLELVSERLPNTTVISVGHRPELEEFHERKLVLEHRPGGARFVRDEHLTIMPGRRVHLFRRLFRRRRDQEGGEQEQVAMTEEPLPLPPPQRR